MDKLNEAIDLMQKLCNINITIDDLYNLQIDTNSKQEIVDTINNARLQKVLNRVLDIMNKVESGNTMHQGGNN
ncbi:MAG: hypothetical protein IKO34_03435 [Bacteroidales bacterium]|jgi:hypothetical protein|nr:hypothetical protein [Bacteroidales bacterium]MBR4582846.1 hypothetical protein [Bacteroidales bacterium]